MELLVKMEDHVHRTRKDNMEYFIILSPGFLLLYDWNYEWVNNYSDLYLYWILMQSIRQKFEINFNFVELSKILNINGLVWVDA